MVAMEDHATWLSILSLAVLFIFSLLLMRSRVSGRNKLNLPPAPSKLPIIGNLHQLGVPNHCSLRELSHKHGPLMLLQLGCIPTLVVSSADMAEEFMKTHDLDFASRPQLSFAKKILYNCRDVSFATYGEYLRQTKKMCMVELLSKKRVDSFGFVRDEEVSNMVITIYNSSKDVGVNMREEFISFTNDIISRVALGKKYTDTRSFCELAKETSEAVSAFSLGDFFPAFQFVDVLTGVDGKQRKVFGRWDGFLGGIIEEHRKAKRDENEHKDFVDVLLHVQKHSLLDIPFTTNDIKAVILQNYPNEQMDKKEMRKKMAKIWRDVRGDCSINMRKLLEELEKTKSVAEVDAIQVQIRNLRPWFCSPATWDDFVKFRTTEEWKVFIDKYQGIRASFDLVHRSSRMGLRRMLTFQLMHTSMQRKVELMHYKSTSIAVAVGELMSVDPNEHVHSIPIGEGNCKVLIEAVIIPCIVLFRETPDARSMDEAVGSKVAWPLYASRNL